MKIDSKWLDNDENIKPNSWDRSSENPSTFNAIVGMLLHKTGKHNRDDFDLAQLNANKHLTNGGRYLTNDYDIEKVDKWDKESSFGTKVANTFKLSHTLKLERSPERFSLDETTGVVCSSFYFTREEFENTEEWYQHQDNLEIVEPNTNQTWYRFYDVGRATRYAKNPMKLTYHEGRNVMMPDKRLIAGIECWAKRAFSSTSKDASGNYHASGKVQAWIRCVGLGLDLERVTKDMPEKGRIVEMFGNFFPEKNHPINEMARRLYL